MSLTAWRLVKQKHAKSPFSAEGARRFGGRWNSRGVPVVYASESLSLAILEMLVHLEDSSMLAHYRAAQATFPEDLVEVVDEALLPRDWHTSPPRRLTQELGDQWVEEARSPVLQVPSAVVDGHNFVLNPNHDEFGRVELRPAEPVRIDQRILKS